MRSRLPTAPLLLDQALPRPGSVWGAYPLRASDDVTPLRRRPHACPAALRLRRIAAAAARAETASSALTRRAQRDALPAGCQGLRRAGFVPAAVAGALGAAGAAARATLGWIPRPAQYQAAAALLDGRMAEMATGEGKTLAIALAAAVAALAGVPVHVVTANPYLARRDADRMRPFFQHLGVQVAHLDAAQDDTAQDDTARRAAYASAVVYATAQDLAFDFLRDRQALAGRGDAERQAAAIAGTPEPAPLLRGLCMALLDEADSILLDEAEVPLILSRSAPHAARRAFLWQAMAIARQFTPAVDFRLPDDASGADVGTVALTPAGEDRLASLGTPLGGPWLRPRYRREAVLVALAALHLYRRDRHYVVRDGRIELIDEITGRVAEGRVWSRGLHVAVALKESASPPPETDTVAQTTFQRFFQRYWRLAGISGTLREAAGELRTVYGLPVVRIPPHRPSRRETFPLRRFMHAGEFDRAVAERAAQLSARGRPVLIGTDSVADSRRLSAALARHGVAHALLHALNDADEAAIVAGAGRAGRVTVATRMAGRGTDIELDAAARAAGGLHVLNCQHNPSRRLDRQLAGRAARAGDPGSAESWRLAVPQLAGGPESTHDPLHPPAGRADKTEADEGSSIPGISGDAGPTRSPTLPPCPRPPFSALSNHFAAWLLQLSQRREERRRAAARRELLRQDQEWEERLAFSGPER